MELACSASNAITHPQRYHFGIEGKRTRSAGRLQFGNGVRIRQEKTPLFAAYERFCTFLPGSGPGYVADSSDIYSLGGSFADRAYDVEACSFLAAQLGMTRPGLLTEVGWDASANSGEPIRVPPDVMANSLHPFETFPTGPVSAYGIKISNGLKIWKHLVGLDFAPKHAGGELRYRPIEVEDTLGRKLVFKYNDSTSASSPSSGLLSSVSGPAGTKLTFEYDRPSQLKTRRQMSRLTGVKRLASGMVTPALDDSVWKAREMSGDFMEFEYTYEDDLSGPNAFESVFLTFFERIHGCGVINNAPCGIEVHEVTEGNPCFFTANAVDKLKEEIANNITVVKRAGRVVVESIYETDPASQNFDRVIKQAFGGSVAANPSGDFGSNLPEFHFDYVSAGPLAASSPPSPAAERTESWLPAYIRNTYPLENLPTDQDWLNHAQEADATISCNDGTGECSVISHKPPNTSDENDTVSCDPNTHAYTTASGKQRVGCDFRGVNERLGALPGYRPTFDFFEYDEAHGAELRRTYLTCAQIATQYMYDVEANGTLGYVNTASHITHNVERRARVERDLQRICRWSKTSDRAGNLSFTGMNFRGQRIVEANLTPVGNFEYVERRFNADGRLLMESDPAIGGQSLAHTEYVYHTFQQPTDSGFMNIPSFWQVRGNLLSATYYPALPVDTSEGPTEAQVTKLRYEPLFQQVQSIEKLRISNGLEQSLSRTDFLFDYQELVLFGPAEVAAGLNAESVWDPGLGSVNTIAPALAFAASQGVMFPLNSSESQLTLDASEGYSGERFFFSPTFYGEDINGDGIEGFSGGSLTTPHHRAKAVPIVIQQVDTYNGLSDAITTYVAYAPNGAVSAVAEESGRITYYNYWKSDADFGQQPTSVDASGGHTGLLAQVVTNRLAEVDMPPELGNGCESPQLVGPYRYLLEDCGNISQKLADIGVAPEIRAELGKESWDSQWFSYSPTGQISVVYEGADPAAARVTSITRDSWGRVLEENSPGNIQTQVGYTREGWVKSVDINNGSGVVLSEKRTFHDNVGNPLATCAATVAGGCNSVFSNGPPNLGATIPNGVVSVFAYDPKDRLSAQSTGPLMDTYLYDYADRIVSQSQTDIVGGETRTVDYVLDDYGRVVTTQLEQGAGLPSLVRSTTYNDLGQIIGKDDSRGEPWNYEYNSKGELVYVGQANGAGKPLLEMNIAYGDYGFAEYKELRNEFGVLDSISMIRDDVGRVIKSQSLGEGFVYYAHDTAGNVVLTINPEQELVQFSTYDPESRRTTQTTSQAQEIVTSSFNDVDVRGRTTTATELGWAGNSVWDSRTQTWSYDDALKSVLNTAPDGYQSKKIQNLLGWVTETHQMIGAGNFDVTTITHDSMGNPETVTDPLSQTTTTQYNGFGQPTSRQKPGNPFAEEWEYDGLGRISKYTTPNKHYLEKTYDVTTGDSIREDWIRFGSPMIAADIAVTRTFDGLGRVETETSTNQALVDAGFMTGPEAEVGKTFSYDGLGRILTEDVDTLGVQGQITNTYLTDPWTNTWTRTATYPSGQQVDNHYDKGGRLAAQTITPSGLGVLQTLNYDWVGSVFAGKVHNYSPSADPLVEEATFGSFGERNSWHYRALEFNGSTPIDSVWADDYCVGSAAYDPARCGEPVLQIDVERDILGRLRSVDDRFGYPAVDAQYAGLPDTTHTQRWNGYQYDDARRLSRVSTFEDSAGSFVSPSVGFYGVGMNGVVQTSSNTLAGLPTGFHADVDRIRQVGVGSLTAITPVGGSAEWSATRGNGHELSSVSVDGQPFAITHDDDGRVKSAFGVEYHHDIFGRLNYVTSGGNLVEGYLYDGSNRMVARFTNTEDEVFVHDGNQMVASLSPDGANAPIVNWEAVYGPGQDQLVHFADHIAGTEIAPLINHRNSIVGAWDVLSGQMLEVSTYSAEGRATVWNSDEQSTRCVDSQGSQSEYCAGPGGLPFGFHSQYRSTKTGLIYMRNRWYSPSLGQFMSHDPLGHVDSYNLYAFVGMDPINSWDPWGLEWTYTRNGNNLSSPRSYDEPWSLRQYTPNMTEASPWAGGLDLPPEGSRTVFIVGRKLQSLNGMIPFFNHVYIVIVDSDGNQHSVEGNQSMIDRKLDVTTRRSGDDDLMPAPGTSQFESRWKAGLIEEVATQEISESEAAFEESFETAVRRSVNPDPEEQIPYNEFSLGEGRNSNCVMASYCKLLGVDHPFSGDLQYPGAKDDIFDGDSTPVKSGSTMGLGDAN